MSMPLTDQAVRILTKRQLKTLRLADEIPASERLDELADRALGEVVRPFLTSSSNAVEQEWVVAVTRMRDLRLEANWLLLKRDGVTAVFARTLEEINRLKTELTASRFAKVGWGIEAIAWLGRLSGHYRNLTPLGQLMDSNRQHWERLPLEMIERSLPKDPLPADVESVALNCVAMVVEGDVREFNEARLAFAIAAAKAGENDLAEFLGVLVKVITEVFQAYKGLPEKGLSLQGDPLTIFMTLFVSLRESGTTWLSTLADLIQRRFPKARARLIAISDPEEADMIKLRLHIPSNLDAEAQVLAESGFWTDLSSKLSPDVAEFLVLTNRPVEHEPAGIP